MMLTQRSFEPNDRITFSLTVMQYNTMIHQLRRSIPVVMYDELHSVILELQSQLQKFIEAASAENIITPPSEIAPSISADGKRPKNANAGAGTD